MLGAMVYLFLLLSTAFSWAQVDLHVGTQGRTLPALGIEFYAESGYGLKFWGEKEKPSDFLYGFVRPSLQLSSSAVINSVKAEFEVFPISFLGFAVGRQYQDSNYNFPFLDCDKVQCTGGYERNFVESKIALAASDFVLTYNYKVDTVTSPDRTRPMADWRNVIIGEAGEDIEIDQKMVIGKQFAHKMQMIGVMGERTQFQGSHELKEGLVGVYQYKHKDTNYMFGAGTFRTSQQAEGFIFYFRINHQLMPTLKLF
jgi:hypothetical protein